MFTPPPSPLPAVRQAVDSSDVSRQTSHPIEDTHLTHSKQRFRSSIRWTIILVPLSLILLAVFARFRAHPVFLDLLLADGNHELIEWTGVAGWSFHEPHSAASHRSVKRYTSNFPVVRGAAPSVPTVPTNPQLPTPFPQPFDETLSANFSTTACYDFFINMTETNSFRSCRPFSLMSTSYAFSQAQDNANLMNTIIWGTCNTDTTQEQCDANMSWFASSLQSSCQIDLSNQVETVVLTLNALHAYDLMRNAACAVDSSTNAYCFVEAVANSDPTDFWFYQLPLGQPLGPNITTNACDTCTTALMASYAAALNNTEGTIIEGLVQTYNAAVETLNQVCGTTYAKVTPVSNASSGCLPVGVPGTLSLVVLVGLVAFTGMLCGG